MYVMRGQFPVRSIVHYMPWSQWWLKAGVILGGKIVSPTVPFKRLFFLEDALKFRAALPDMPLVYVGGVTTRKDADKVIDSGFQMLQMGRAVLEDTDFVNKMKDDENHCSECEHSNFCIGRMYSLSMACHKTQDLQGHHPGTRKECPENQPPERPHGTQTGIQIVLQN